MIKPKLHTLYVHWIYYIVIDFTRQIRASIGFLSTESQYCSSTFLIWIFCSYHCSYHLCDKSESESPSCEQYRLMWHIVAFNFDYIFLTTITFYSNIRCCPKVCHMLLNENPQSLIWILIWVWFSTLVDPGTSHLGQAIVSVADQRMPYAFELITHSL